jgi:hypothetical protein
MCYAHPMALGITAQAKEDNVYYNVQWSALSLAERWTINAKVPSVAGVYEIYWKDEYNHLRMMTVGKTLYGGLRTEIRRLTDPELVTNPKARQILENEEIWFRYVPSNSVNNMTDVVWFFRATYFPENPGVEHSGRYKKIFLKESAPDKLIWVP